MKNKPRVRQSPPVAVDQTRTLREYNFFELQEKSTEPESKRYFRVAQYDGTDLPEAQLWAKDRIAALIKERHSLRWLLPSELCATGQFRLVRCYKRCENVPFTSPV